MTTSKIMLRATAVVATACASPLTLATEAATSDEEPAALALEEVIVTAQRREASLQDTPIAVTAISGEELRSQNVTTLADIARNVPGLSISTASTTAPAGALPVVYIRGIGQQDPAIFSDPGVGIYVDGVYVSRSAGSVIDLPDIERVEVLRGPQGTLFGKNAVGGAVNIVTQPPPSDFAGHVELAAGNYELADVRGAVGGPFSDTVRGGLAFAYRRQDGFMDRLEYPSRRRADTQGGIEHIGSRGRLQIAPSETFTLDLSADYTHYNDETAAGVTTIYPPTPVYNAWNGAVGVPSGAPWTPATTNTGDAYATFATGPNFSDVEIYGGSATATWEADSAIFRSISAYRSANETYSRDSDGSSATFFSAIGAHELEQFSQELQLFGTALSGSLDWIGGAYYMKEDGEQQDDALVAPGLFTATRNPALEIGRLYTASIDNNSYAGFGQITYRLTAAIGVTAGLRYTVEEKSSVVSSFGQESGTLYVAPTLVDKEWDALTPKLGLEYRASNDVLLYASATKGFKSGGFNGRVARPEALSTFDPEVVWSYEAGLKSTWFARRLRLNAAVYSMDYDDLQLAKFTLTPTGVLNTVENVAAAELWGAEVEITATPARSLQLSLAVAYNENEYTEVEPGASVAIGQHIPFTPEWSGSASAQYEFPLQGGAELTPRVEVSHKSSTYATLNNTPPSFLPGYTLLSTRLTYRPASGAWRLSAYGTNLTDRLYYVAAQDNTTASLLYRLTGRPREYGLSFRMDF